MSAVVIVVGSDGEARVVPESATMRALARGRARLAAEAARIEQIKSDAAIPPECGPEMPVAPGRGPMRRFTPRVMVRTASGGFRSQRDGHDGHDAAAVADVFDRMDRAAQRANAALNAGRRKKGLQPVVYLPLFTVGQVAVAREYAALVERVSAAGVKCASLEALRQSSSGGGDREVAILRDIQQMRSMQARIGNDLVKGVRRVRPSASDTGIKRSAIYARRLVDMVCCGDMSLAEVLEAHHWAKKGETVRALHVGLCAALDRMRGFDLVRPTQGA